MKTLIVFDSWYGNTERIAQAIATNMGDAVELINLHDDPSVKMSPAELLIVGSPTHGGVATPQVQEWLRHLGSDQLHGTDFAAFDTRVPMRWLKIIGFAGRHIARELQRKGGRQLAPPIGFYVHGKEGPLRAGEQQRAAEWGEQLLEASLDARHLAPEKV